MAIYKMANQPASLEEVAHTSFSVEGVLEADLQRILRDQPDVLEEGLLVISEEFGNWEDSNRRIDLLGLDNGGRLTVVELKRGETGGHMDLQAIRYAAMVANMTFQDVVDTYQDYLERRAKEVGESAGPDDAKTRIREHLPITEQDNQEIHTEIPRLILVAENFGKELTTCVMWLNDSWLRSAGEEIKCVRLQPHKEGDEILIEASVVIPLPDAAEYRTQLKKREQDTRALGSPGAERLPSGDPFNGSIANAEEEFQPDLRRLYESALHLEKSKLAELFTYVNGKRDYIRLELRLPGESKFLASFNNLLGDGGIGEISLWPGWEERAPDALGRIDEIVGPARSASGVRHRKLSVQKTYSAFDDILTAIGDAYQEASGEAPAQ